MVRSLEAELTESRDALADSEERRVAAETARDDSEDANNFADDPPSIPDTPMVPVVSVTPSGEVVDLSDDSPSYRDELIDLLAAFILNDFTARGKAAVARLAELAKGA